MLSDFLIKAIKTSKMPDKTWREWPLKSAQNAVKVRIKIIHSSEPKLIFPKWIPGTSIGMMPTITYLTMKTSLKTKLFNMGMIRIND